jgi:sulfate adenylyltransferase subunit 2
MKTEALRQALDAGKFDAAIGGARRDEEKSRAKERIFSHRTAAHVWDPRHQRPELWSLFNTQLGPGESMRVFPLSNWTERDVWQYIREQNIPIVPLYYARQRQVVRRGPNWIPIDNPSDIRAGETVTTEWVRFRTLGCMPCTGAVQSQATTIDEIVDEAAAATRSERETRVIDHGANTMEDKKREGYF